VATGEIGASPRKRSMAALTLWRLNLINDRNAIFSMRPVIGSLAVMVNDDLHPDTGILDRHSGTLSVLGPGIDVRRGHALMHTSSRGRAVCAG
jgi:hypothetical protein